ncbi:MAG TPA: pyridoxamine 5'-phosphate oxidase [Actinopolymorphaceae bacterium]
MTHAGGSDDLEPTAALADMRRRYGDAALDEADLYPDPLGQFQRWLADAIEAGLAEPNAMIVATSTRDGRPSARTVLLKGLDERGFVFYTNLESAKSSDLAENPRAALVFPWHAIQRQVRVTGTVTPVDRAEAAAYFATRPRESQLGAWASRQSHVVPDRATLDRTYAEMQRRFPPGSEVPLPDFWGGYRVRPDVYEFWQGREGRLHDRIRYRRSDPASSEWIIERLAP